MVAVVLAFLSLFTVLGAAHGRSLLPSPEHHIFREHGGRELRARWIRALVQDPQGMLWVGTQEGLYRYDGAEAVLIGEDEGLPETYVLQLSLGPRGRVWAALGGRVARQTPGGFVTVVPEQPGRCAPSMYELQRMAFTTEGDLLASTGCGLVRVRGPDYTTVERVSDDPELPRGAVQALHVAADGEWWLASGRTVFRRPAAGGPPKVVPLPPEELDEAVQALATSRDGRTWARTRSVLYRLDPGATAFATEPEQDLGALDVTPPYEDSRGRLLLPTHTGLAIRSPKGAWETLSQVHGLPGSSVGCALEDREGTMWLGVLGAGLLRWQADGRWRAWTQAEGLPHDSVWGMLRDSQQRLWVGTNDGLGVWDPATETWRHRGPQHGLPGQLVWGFASEDNGTIWAVMRRRAVARFTPGSLEPRAVELPAGCGPVPTDVSPSPDGSVLLAGPNGLCRATSDVSGVHITPLQSHPATEQCSELVEAFGDTLWTAGERGLCHFDGTTWRHFDSEDGLQADSLLALAPESASTAWVSYASGRGMTQVHVELDTNGKSTGALQTRHLKRSDGLPSNHVWLLRVDRWGKVWSGGPRGLAVLHGDGTISRHDSEDGLIWDDVNQGALLFEEDGAVLVGTSRGLARFDPHTKSEEIPPSVVITGARLGASTQRISAPKDAAASPSPTKVGYEDNTFSVQFACVTYASPQSVQYGHRLVGAEEQESVGPYRTLRYPSLRPGTYRFEVRCRSADGLWSERRASFAFQVLPPWWDTGWLRALGAAGLAAVLLLLVKRREGRQLAQRRELEAEVAERSARLADANRLLEELSFTDPLTGLHNRRYLESTLPSEAQRAVRRHRPTHLGPPGINQDILFLMVDLDHFKDVNDTHGHAVGDEVLIETARRLRASMRVSDLVLRWGGEEFLLVCRDAERSEGPAIAARALQSVGGRPFETAGGLSLRRTCSIGWAAFPFCPACPSHATTEQVIDLADRALYRAKAAGRNRAVGVEALPEGLSAEEDATAALLEEGLEQLEGRVLRLLLTPGPGCPPESA